jgi:preprotein translocase subunit SecE
MDLRLYVQESLEELKTKISWPTWDNLLQTTMVVLLASLILAAIIFTMDTTANFLLKQLYGVK